MAVKTSFSPMTLTNMLANYDLGTYLDSRVFEHGRDQTNILLVTSKGKYAFRYYEKRSSDYTEFEIDLLRFLSSKLYPCPTPMQRTDGAFVGAYQDKPYALFSFLSGEHSEDKNNYQLVAPMLGKLHQLTAGYIPPHANARASYSSPYVWSWAESNARKITPATKAQSRLDWLNSELDTLQLPDSLPIGICHCDSNPTNFLYQHGHISAVLDFDQASYIWLLYDVAQLIYWWAWPDKGNLGIAIAKDLIACYDAVRKLEEQEKEHLFDMLKLVHLVGIGWSLADDSFENDKRKVVELNELGRGNLRLALFG